MNVKLLRKVAKHILAEPKRLAMGSWVQRKGDDDFNGNSITKVKDDYSDGCEIHPFAKCGTAACIAGWTVLLTAKNPASVSEGDIERLAVKELGITSEYDSCDGLPESERLFFVGEWPSKFEERYRQAKTPITKARAAVARIEHFIKTKGAE